MQVLRLKLNRVLNFVRLTSGAINEINVRVILIVSFIVKVIFPKIESSSLQMKKMLFIEYILRTTSHKIL